MLETPKDLETYNVKLPDMNSNSTSEMGNQQETVAAARLAMLFDTEGTITMRVQQKSRRRPANMVPIVHAVNTDKGLIDWAAEALTLFNVAHYIYTFDPTRTNIRARLIQHRIVILGMKRVAKLLPVIMPFLIVKRQQATWLSEFIESRQGRYNEAYNELELSIANNVRALNQNKNRAKAWRPISSETLCQARELRTMLNGKIKSGLHGDMQSAAEMTAPVAS